MATLFVCNLNYNSSENDLNNILSQFGEILEIVKHYPDQAAVSFKAVDGAKRALKAIDGAIIQGNTIKGYLLKKTAYESASIHIRFCSITIDKIISEESLMQIFRQYGEIEEICIKDAVIDKKGYHKGYGFIHFKCDSKGVSSAIFCAEKMISFVFEGVQYKCEMSKNLSRNLIQSVSQSPQEQNWTRPAPPAQPPTHESYPNNSPVFVKYSPVISHIDNSPSYQTTSMCPTQIFIVPSPPAMYQTTTLYPCYTNEFSPNTVCAFPAYSGTEIIQQQYPTTMYTTQVSAAALPHTSATSMLAPDNVSVRKKAQKTLSYLSSLS